MTKATRARYTQEFKREAVRLVEAGQGKASVAKTLGVSEQTLFNWVKASEQDKLIGAGNRAVSAEQMEIARLRVELAQSRWSATFWEKATATPAAKRRSARSGSSDCTASALPLCVTQRTRRSPGCCGTTKPGCTRR